MAVDLLERLGEPLLRGPGHPAQRLVEILDRRRQIVVLRPQERQTLVQLAVLLGGDQVDGADRLQPCVQLDQSLAHGDEIAAAIVQVAQRRGVDAVPAIRLLRQLLAAHAPLGRLQLDPVDGADQAIHLALDGA